MYIQSITSLTDNHCKNEDIFSVSITKSLTNAISPLRIRFSTDPLISSITLCLESEYNLWRFTDHLIVNSTSENLNAYFEMCHRWNDGWLEYPLILSWFIMFILFIFVSLTILILIVRKFEDLNCWTFVEISFVYWLIEERRPAYEDHFYPIRYLK